MILVLWGCYSIQSEVYVSSTGDGTLLHLYPGGVEKQLRLSKAYPDRCDPEPSSCLLFEVERREEGITAAWCSDDGNTPGAPGGIFHQVDDQLQWEVTDLDFQEADPDLATHCEGADDPLCGLNFTHSFATDPAGELLAVADTDNSRVLVLEVQDGPARVRQVLDRTASGWGDRKFPNRVQWWAEEERSFLLVTYKSRQGATNEGSLLLWELTDPHNPVRRWAFPEQGALAAPHNAILDRETGLLSYGHSLGSAANALNGTEGSVGLALYQGPERSPVYVADLSAPRFGFVREAELDGDGLLVTDSGCQTAKADCGHSPAILRVALPELSAAGLSGAWSADHEQQKFVAAEIVQVEVEGPMRLPFEADR
jgi:hypothetical protein